MNDKIISIVGLTASGKSAIGIKLAQLFDGEIISADSRQVYRGLDIGSAKVTKEEQALVPHHLLDVVNPMEHFDVFMFQQLATPKISDIKSRGKLPIIVGGTGLYSRAVLEEYTFEKAPLTTPSKEGDELHSPTNERNDHISTDSHTDINSPSCRRVKRQFLQIALLPPKEWLRPRIEQRNEERLKQGNLEETKQLLKDGVCEKWLQKLGLDYYWNIELVRDRITLDEYIYWLAIKTMQYAKRQRTWFKREKNTVFLTNPDTFLDDCIRLVRCFLSGG